MEEADIRISTKADTLSDGSQVFNVTVFKTFTRNAIVLPAVTERDAYELVEKITKAINEHTTFSANSD